MHEILKSAKQELEGKKQDTFLYQLHECSIWSELLLQQLFDCCNCLLHYHRKINNDASNELLQLLADRLAYIASLVFCHFSEYDTFSIKNWNEQIERISVPYFFNEYRKIAKHMLK